MQDEGDADRHGCGDRKRGFILQASYRIVNLGGDSFADQRHFPGGGALSRTPALSIPVVHLYGVLEGGGTFLVRDRRQRPHFFIRQRDLGRARRLGAVNAGQAGRRTFAGESVARVELNIPQDAPPLRERLHRAGIDTFEADVRFAVRYLIDRGIRGGCEIRGEWTPGANISRTYEDPELKPADLAVKPSVLSFDIETDPEAKRLLAVALYGCGLDEVYIVNAGGRTMPDRALGLADERAVLDAFCGRVMEADPDVLTGWNVIDFDLSVLARIATRLRHPFEFGRDRGKLRIRKAQGYFGSGQASVPGRLVLDGIDLVRGAFLRLNDYSLDAVANQVLGEGKEVLAEHPSSNRAADIQARYRDNLPAFAAYARTDARLALEILERLGLVNLAVARSRLTGMTPDRVSASIASFDFLYLSALHRRGVVAPTVRSAEAGPPSRRQAGGHVLEPVTGLHNNVWVFDFKSLYPSLMRTFNIDPLGFEAQGGSPDAVIRVSADAAFRREEAILPAMLDRLFPQREAAKAAGDGVASQAIKILMNSFYGVLGTPACRFHNAAIANAITGLGRRFLQWSKAWFEQRGFTVLYGDTDSLFVSSGLAEVTAAKRQGPLLAKELNAALDEYIHATWRVSSRLEMEFEKLYVKLFLPSVRHGGGGARKRYAGLLEGEREPEFTGMEVVRRDWTQLAKDVQRELFARLFAGEPMDGYLQGVAKSLRQGDLDSSLIYRKGLRKSLAAYTASTPPHVVAARKSADPGRVIAYVVTTAGPEPLDALEHEPDREHYLQKQVRPVAEPILTALGLDFDRTVGDDQQMDLF